MNLINSVLSRISKKDASVVEDEQHSPRTSATQNLVRDKQFLSNFVPHSCHYDEHTVLNKNGELLQTIKMSDYEFAADVEHADLRSSIRASVFAHVKTQKVALWVQTVRRKHEFKMKWDSAEKFNSDLHNAKVGNDADKYHQYINDVYVTFVYKGSVESIFNFISALSFSYLKSRHKIYLESNAKKLSAIVESVVRDLSHFKARRLGVVNGCSEILSLFQYFLNMTYEEFPLKMGDVAEQIFDHRIKFGFNSFVTQKDGGSQKFAAILGLKDYRDSSLEAMDLCLQRHLEFVVTEVIRFVNHSDASKTFLKQAETLQISGDTDLFEKSGLKEIVSMPAYSPVSFCEHRINIMVIAETSTSLALNVDDITHAFSMIGLTMVRYDLGMEDAMWSNLPGNFPFVLKPKYILSKYSFGFAVFHTFPSGALANSRWGRAISIFFADNGRPYFFNFHATADGHTVLIGPPQSGRTILMNFLLSETRNISSRIVMLDYSGKSLIFIKAMNGIYHLIDPRPDAKVPAINPLFVDETNDMRAMLKGLIARMISSTVINDEALLKKISDVVEHIFTLPKETRCMSDINDMLLTLGGNISKWCVGGEFSSVFSATNYADIDWASQILCFNTGMIGNKLESVRPIIYFVLEMLIAKLDGSPTILVLDEIWKLSHAFIDQDSVDVVMQRLTKLNVVVLFTTENTASIRGNFSSYISPYIDTRIFMPNFSLNRIYMKSFSLTKEEYDMMLQIPSQDRHFLVKQGGRSVILGLDLSGAKEVSVLSSNQNTIKCMHEAILEKGDLSSDWLPLFYEKCKIQ